METPISLFKKIEDVFQRFFDNSSSLRWFLLFCSLSCRQQTCKLQRITWLLSRLDQGQTTHLPIEKLIHVHLSVYNGLIHTEHEGKFGYKSQTFMGFRAARESLLEFV